MIDSNTDQIEKIQKAIPKVENEKIKEKLKERILKLEDGITQRRINAILAAEKAGKMSNMIHNITFVGQALILIDLTGRAYVWFKLDRDPTISPVATFVRKSLQ
jgi:DNA polymerase III delta prime subunit